MKYSWKFAISALISLTLLIALSRSWHIGNLQLPPLGDFVNPFTGFWSQAESGKAGSHEQYRSSSVNDSIEIEFDKRMVPHVFTTHSKDAFYAQGFLHAKNRLFQMDLTARAVEGTLSEILGAETLGKDIFARRINFPLAVENKYKSWQYHPEVMEYVVAYVRGVNDYISSLKPKNYPIEYKLIDATPAPWSVHKTVAVTISLAATLNLNLQDFRNTNTLLALGEMKYQHLFPLFPDKLRPVVPQRETYPKTGPELTPQDYQQFNYMKEDNPPMVEPGTGSNNWAVNAIMTKDSVPMLANDPHLNLSLPSIWYELQLQSPDFNVHGVSVPGMPSIVIGFNQSIAWGLTNAALDVLDTYKIKWADRENRIYMLDDKETEATKRIEKITIKGRPDHMETVYDTYWGPILYDDDNEEDHQRQDIAVKWVSSLPSDKCDVKALLGLMKAKDLEDYQTALTHFYFPGQNIVFASSKDSIAITVQGKFPIKKPHQGRFVLDGSLTENDWHGFIPDADLPRVVNPESKYIVSANEWPTYSEYPYYYSGHFDHYRGRAIASFLENQKPLTVTTMKNIQNSNFNLKAAEVLPLLLPYLDPTDEDRSLIDSLKAWNYYYDADDPLPTLTEFWLDECLRLTFDEIDAPESVPTAIPEIWRFQRLVEQNPYDRIFDIVKTTPKVESARDIIRMAWSSAFLSYKKLTVTQRPWGKYAGLDINHLLNISDFSHKNLFTGGNGNTINATTQTHGPSWRMIVELHQDSVQAHVIYPGGQSGNPGSSYYDNFIGDWLLGRYYPVRIWNKPKDIEEPLHYTMTIIPKK